MTIEKSRARIEMGVSMMPILWILFLSQVLFPQYLYSCFIIYTECSSPSALLLSSTK
jgi:hypothetical protein